MLSSIEEGNPHRITILGIPISVVNLPRATTLVSGWAKHPGARTVFVREVASLMAAVDEPILAKLHHEADLIVPDGTPLVWVARILRQGRQIGRVAGADLLDAVCERSLLTGQSHYFYGGKPGVAESMASRLSARYPGLKIAGTFSPPMRSIDATFELDDDLFREIDAIKASNADFVWVGISSPKQEYWMMKVAPLLEHGVLFGVGAAFDFQSGAVKRAPKWMRDNGMEWAHRLASEPRRLWRRYLVLAPRFVLAVARDFMLRSDGTSRRHAGGETPL